MKKVIIVTLIIIIIYLGKDIIIKNNNTTIETTINLEENSINNEENNTIEVDALPVKNQIDDWRLTLVNYENELPVDYEFELENIDSTRKFDSRAIDELNQMLKAIKNDGINNVWVQSAYRSIEYQNKLFNNKINTYMKQGKTKEEAESLTLKTINKPGTSEHNLGLAIDFNYVDYSFDETKGFKWLQENAEDYGFILRYRKDKVDITKVDYEPWHWRYVGVEHAKKINELDVCLEEYIEILNNHLFDTTNR